MNDRDFINKIKRRENTSIYDIHNTKKDVFKSDLIDINKFFASVILKTNMSTNYFGTPKYSVGQRVIVYKRGDLDLSTGELATIVKKIPPANHNYHRHKYMVAIDYQQEYDDVLVGVYEDRILSVKEVEYWQNLK